MLTGFQPWLVAQVGCLDNHVGWSIAHLTEPTGPKNFRDMDHDLGARTVEAPFDVLDEFLELRDEHDGLNRIFAAHEHWRRLREQNGCNRHRRTYLPHHLVAQSRQPDQAQQPHP
ncbi:hypothetical protein [Micromonospora chersina]|uniref:hypothetical protein n=1 Tax=Micromonospora chersina TaxID=47854 RepID=UPI0033B259E8